MDKIKVGFVGLFALLALVVGVLLFQHSTPRGEQHVQSPNTAEHTGSSSDEMITSPVPGHVAPDFTLQDMAGKQVKLSALRGKPVLVNFWASWCPPCRQEMPDLAKKADEYKGRVQFYGVNLTVQDKVEDAKAFAQSAGVAFPILLDKNGDVAKEYHVQAIPSTFLIDAKGQIKEVIPGGMTAEIMDSLLKQLVQQ